jgi:hypothetical protein
MEKSIARIVRQSIYLGVIVTLAATSAWIYHDKSQMEETLESSRQHAQLISEKVEAHAQGLKVYALLTRADQLFIEGDFDQALVFYRELADVDSLKHLVRSREAVARAFQDDKSKALALVVSQQREDALKQAVDSIKREMLAAERSYLESQRNVQADRHKLELRLLEMEKAVERERKEVDEIRQNRNLITFRSVNGNKVHYIGDIENDRANGYGIGIWDTGGVYKGEWVNNQRWGKGRYDWADGEWYVGEFKSDMRNGTGTYYFKNGERYEGQWKDNKRHGQGVVYDKNNVVLNEGVWTNDSFASNKTNGENNNKP